MHACTGRRWDSKLDWADEWNGVGMRWERGSLGKLWFAQLANHRCWGSCVYDGDVQAGVWEDVLIRLRLRVKHVQVMNACVRVYGCVSVSRSFFVCSRNWIGRGLFGLEE